MDDNCILVYISKLIITIHVALSFNLKFSLDFVVSFQPHTSVVVNMVAVIAQKWISVKNQGKSLNLQSQAGGMLDREAYASLAFIRPPMVPRLRPMALMAYGTNCGSSHAVWLSLAEYCILWMSEKTNPSVAIRHDAILLRVDGGLVLAYPNPTLLSVDAQTSRGWIQNIYRLAGEMASDNPGSDLAWHVQWVTTTIMASSYFLFVCAIVTAQGLRHRFSLNKTEEGSPRRHSKFLNLFSVVRWEAVINKRISQKCALHEPCFRFPNSGCSAHGGLNGTCYSEAECRKRQGLVAGQLLFMSSKSFC